MAKDIFISYRRKGAKMEAMLLYEKLTAAGYNVFLDFMSLHSGEFNEEIRNTITNCKDFILLISPNCFKRCEEPDDCYRQEIEWALKEKKHIIQIKTKLKNYPSKLPESLKELKKKNAFDFPPIPYVDGLIRQLQEEGNLSSIPSRSPVQPGPQKEQEIRMPENEGMSGRCRTCNSKNIRISDPLNFWLTGIHLYIQACKLWSIVLLITLMLFAIAYILPEIIPSTAAWMQRFVDAALPLQEEFWAFGTDVSAKLRGILTVDLLICFIPWVLAYRTNHYAENMYLREAEKGHHWLSCHCAKCGSRYKEKLDLYFLSERDEQLNLTIQIIIVVCYTAINALVWTVLTEILSPGCYPLIPFLTFLITALGARAFLINRVNIHLEQLPRFAPLKEAYYFVNDLIDSLGNSENEDDSEEE